MNVRLGRGGYHSRVPAPSLPAPGQPPWRRTAAVGAAGFALGCLFLLLQLVRLDAVSLRWNAEARQPQVSLDVTAPFQVGTGWRLDEALTARGIPARITPGHGYDGQWFLGLAYDPLLRDRLAGGFDMPRYRAGRPLQAMAGWLLAAGRTPAIPAALLLVGPLALALGAAASGRLLAAFGRSRWWGLGFALVPGVAVGVIFATAEPLGLSLAVFGLSLALDGRVPAAGAAFAGAGLTKESYLVFAGAAALWLLWSRTAVTYPAPQGADALQRASPAPSRPSGPEPCAPTPAPTQSPQNGMLDRRSVRPLWRGLAGAALVLGPGVAALGAWWAYVARMIPGSAADANATEAVGPPLAGWAATLRLAARGGYVPDFPVGPFGVVILAGSLALALAGVVLGLRRRGPLDQTGLWLGLYGLVLSAALLGHFLSAMRALAPTVLATGLAAAAAFPAGAEPDKASPVGAGQHEFLARDDQAIP